MARGPALLVPLIAAAPLLSGVGAPQNVPSVPQFRTRVDLVVLDVSVLDRDRRPVRGLTAADFTVLEDGRPQAIHMFSAVDIPDPEVPATANAATAAWVREVAPDVRNNEQDAAAQITVLVLDDANPMAAGDAVYARRFARDVVERLGPRDLAAVVFVADARSGQEFTHDQSRLLAAIGRFNGQVPGTPVASRSPSDFSPGWEAGALEWIGPTMTLRTLKGQAEALADLPAARKAVIFISTRGAALPDRLTGLGDAEGQEPARGTDAAGMQVQNFGEFGEFVRAAQRANVNVYCVDPGGLRAPTVASTPFDPERATAAVPNSNVTGIGSLIAISHNTGGFAIVETNDAGPGLTQILRENRSYYLLAYAASNSRVDGRYRRIRVIVNRPAVTVRTRSGYFEPDPKEMRKAAAGPAADALLTAPVARADIPMQLTAVPFAMAGSGTAAVAVALAIRQAATGAAARSTDLSVTVNAYDYLAKRRASDRFHARVVLKPTPSGEATCETLARLDLPPGRYQLRAAVTETTEAASGDPARHPARSGSVFCDLDVPDFTRAPLSVSGVLLATATGVRGAGGDRLKSMLPALPTTIREFAPGDDARAFLRLYQGGKGSVSAVTVTSRIIDARDSPVFQESDSFPPQRFAAARCADYSLALPLARLKPGPHLLAIDVTQGVLTIRRDVRFTMR